MLQEKKEQTNDDKIETFKNNKSVEIDKEYALLIASLDMKGLGAIEADEIYAKCRKARRDRMVKELGY